MKDIPNYDDYSLNELTDAFIQVDDTEYADRAFSLFKLISVLKKKEPEDIEMEDIVEFPVTSSSFRFRSSAIDNINKNYTIEAVKVRDKLVRLKKRL